MTGVQTCALPILQHAAPIVVVDDGGRISGIIPRVTLLAAISEHSQDEGAEEPADADEADETERTAETEGEND